MYQYSLQWEMSSLKLFSSFAIGRKIKQAETWDFLYFENRIGLALFENGRGIKSRYADGMK